MKPGSKLGKPWNLNPPLRISRLTHENDLAPAIFPFIQKVMRSANLFILEPDDSIPPSGEMPAQFESH